MPVGGAGALNCAPQRTQNVAVRLSTALHSLQNF